MDRELDFNEEQEATAEVQEETSEQSTTDVEASESSTYEGKSTEDLINIIKSQEAALSKQSATKVAETKSEPKAPSLTQQQDTIRNDLKKIESEIDQLDLIVDGEDYKKLDRKKSELMDKLRDLEIKRLVGEEFAGRQNKELFNKSKTGYENNFGINDIDDKTWDSIYDQAMSFSSDGIITPEDIESAMIKTRGLDWYRSVLVKQGEQDARQLSATAKSLSRPSIASAGTGQSKDVDLTSMSAYQRDDYLKSLSIEQLDRLIKKR